MRPGPRRPCAISKPRPSPSRRFSAGTRTSFRTTSACPCGASSNPNTGNMRTTSMPGESRGTKTCDCCWCSGASGFVLPITIAIEQRGSPTPEDHHLRPLMTYSSPSRSMRVSILVASEDATAGSVIKKAERILPSSSGSIYSFLCRSLPYRSSTSILPVSGAEQLNTSAAKPTRPIISHKGAYSTLLSP